jgi:hypothetical protein
MAKVEGPAPNQPRPTITDGNVDIDGVSKGKTGQQISFAFKCSTTVDAKTKRNRPGWIVILFGTTRVRLV